MEAALYEGWKRKVLRESAAEVDRIIFSLYRLSAPRSLAQNHLPGR